MLILTRKLNEEIVIDSNVRIKILALNDNQLKIGIEAPQNVKIFRGELYDKIIQEMEEAIKKSSEPVERISKLKVNRIKSIK